MPMNYSLRCWEYPMYVSYASGKIIDNPKPSAYEWVAIENIFPHDAIFVLNLAVCRSQLRHNDRIDRFLPDER